MLTEFLRVGSIVDFLSVEVEMRISRRTAPALMGLVALLTIVGTPTLAQYLSNQRDREVPVDNGLKDEMGNQGAGIKIPASPYARRD